MSEVTRILSAIEQGDPQAAEQLLPSVAVATGWPGDPQAAEQLLALVYDIYDLASGAMRQHFDSPQASHSFAHYPTGRCLVVTRCRWARSGPGASGGL